MFDIGFSELLVIAVVALVVLGPERLPKAARFAGLWVRRARNQWDSVKQELERELRARHLSHELIREPSGEAALARLRALPPGTAVMAVGGWNAGVRVSSDGGATWNKIHNGFPKGQLGRIAIGVAPSKPEVLYAVLETEQDKDKGLYRSEDSGASWKHLNSDFELVVRPFYFSRITVDPRNHDIVYKAGLRGSISRDGGKSFKSLGSMHADIHDITVDLFDSNRIYVATDGGLYRSWDSGNTLDIVKNHNGIYENLSIESLFKSYEDKLKNVFEAYTPDLTEENIQARLRAVLLMAISNKKGYILLNTSNKSEAAVGYGTLYGDMCGALSVLGDVYKTDVFELAKWINRNQELIPVNSIIKPPSAELRPNQKDSDSLPDYEILDAILKLYVDDFKSKNEIIEKGFDPKIVEKVIKLVNFNEYKRYQTPPVLRVSYKAFGSGRKMPLVAKYLF